MKIPFVIVLVVFCIVKISSSKRHSSAKTKAASGKNWVLLVAGSSGFNNYRHQADICHAYHIVKAGGIPEEQIIVMMVDDIAYNIDNPKPGVIINYPNGADVYGGVKIDYKGNTVTPANFLHVLSGNSDAVKGIGSGKVIDSGPNDIVFVNFVDHGGPGILNFPTEVLTVGNLTKTLTSLAEQRKFHKMIVFLEACHSGSMFDSVLDDSLNIFIMTAADSKEPSSACYYDDVSQTFLGDVFSISWMHLVEQDNFTLHSLNHLFEKVRKDTTTSHVKEYGDLDIGNTFLFEVLGNYSIEKPNSVFELYIHPKEDAISTLDVPLHLLRQKRIKFSHLPKEADKIDNDIRTIIHRRTVVKNVMGKIMEKITFHNSKMMSLLEEATYTIDKNILECYDNVIHTFSKNCFNIAKNPYTVHSLQIFVNACHMYFNNERRILQAIENTCINIGDVVGIV